MKASLRQDLPASIVVFFVAVPLCLGIALASGAPPFAGLIAGIIGGLVVGAISGSPLGVSCPSPLRTYLGGIRILCLLVCLAWWCTPIVHRCHGS